MSRDIGPKELAAIVLAFVGCMAALHFCAGCTPPEQQVITENVENAAAVAQYKALLAECRERGRAARSMAVYDACADQLDAELCRTSALRCTDGGAP